jgi:ribosomal protein S27AE
MSYRSISKANLRFQLTVLFVLIGMFVVALILTQLHPTGALIVFLTGMLIAGLAAIAEWIIRKAERAAARYELQSHHCPRCGKDVHRVADAEGQWHCDDCGATFLDSGIEEG